jgi:hypothetical protein
MLGSIQTQTVGASRLNKKVIIQRQIKSPIEGDLLVK